jgi:hypothetical protein
LDQIAPVARIVAVTQIKVVTGCHERSILDRSRANKEKYEQHHRRWQLWPTNLKAQINPLVTLFTRRLQRATERMRWVDQYISRPVQLIVGVWSILFVLSRFKHAYAGYSAALVRLPSDLQCKKDCEQAHWRISDPKHCAEFDAIDAWTPYWSALDSVVDNTWMCGFVPCTTVLDSAVHSLGAFGVYLVFGGVLAAVAGTVLYVLLTRIAAHGVDLSYNRIGGGSGSGTKLAIESEQPRRRIVSVNKFEKMGRLTWNNDDDDDNG